MLSNEPNKRVTSRQPAIPIPEFTGVGAESALYAPDSVGHRNAPPFHSGPSVGKHTPIDAVWRGPEVQPSASHKVLTWTIG